MRIYDYIFYKCYQLSVSSRNFKDTPVIGALTFFILGFSFNLFTVIMTLEGLDLITWDFNKNHRYLYAIIVFFPLLWYYSYNDRYKRIEEKLEQKERKRGIAVHPLLIIMAYTIISFGLLLLAGLYRNKDWIFSA